MRALQQLIRPNILKLIPYSSARQEYTGKSGIFLDANENPFGTLNRYPDPYQNALKSRLTALYGIPENSITIGNGSDELIDLCYRIFCRPGMDKALSFSPSYGMYEVSAAINDIGLTKLPLNDNFQIAPKTLAPYLNDECFKLLFICSPNNPTGNLIEHIGEIIAAFQGIVVVDEAYIDFAEEESLRKRLADFPNLIIIQTMSKARGIAAARIGIAYSSPEIAAIFYKVKPPYNVSALNQSAAMDSLENELAFQQQKTLIIEERERVAAALLNNELVRKVYPSEANFLLVSMVDADAIYQNLVSSGIVTRNRNSLIAGCIRITIGKPEENERLLAALDVLAQNITSSKKQGE